MAASCVGSSQVKWIKMGGGGTLQKMYGTQI